MTPTSLAAAVASCTSVQCTIIKNCPSF